MKKPATLQIGGTKSLFMISGIMMNTSATMKRGSKGVEVKTRGKSVLRISMTPKKAQYLETFFRQIKEWCSAEDA